MFGGAAGVRFHRPGLARPECSPYSSPSSPLPERVPYGKKTVKENGAASFPWPLTCPEPPPIIVAAPIHSKPVPIIETSIAIQATPAKVWAYLADIQGYPRWMKGILSLEITSEATRGVGASFWQVSRGPFGVRVVDDMVCTEWVEGEVLIIEHRGSVKGETSFHVTSIELGSRVRWREEPRLPMGCLGELVFRLFFRRALRRTFSHDLRSLKDLVEGELG